jgi:plastocyanin
MDGSRATTSDRSSHFIPLQNGIIFLLLARFSHAFRSLQWTHTGGYQDSLRAPNYDPLENQMINNVIRFMFIAGGLISVGGRCALPQDSTEQARHSTAVRSAQIVALDECDPTTFNAALGPDFCKNVTLGAFTTLSDLFSKAVAGTPDPGWDFEPDVMEIKEGTNLSVVDQGGEPHTFTEVAHFGGGFIPGLNAPGESTVPECAGGFANVAVAKTRILQASAVQVADLPKGTHLFQCCIHPWMRVKVEVK